MGGEQGGHVVGEVDPLGQRLLLEDRGPGLELGGVDVHPHAPLEAGAEPLLEPLQLLGAAIAGEHDLDVLLVEGVEGVEELLGGLVAAAPGARATIAELLAVFARDKADRPDEEAADRKKLKACLEKGLRKKRVSVSDIGTGSVGLNPRTGG